MLDSDAALTAPYLEMGVAEADLTFGHVVADECARLGLDLVEYQRRYDTDAAQPYPGVVDVVAALMRWAVCSNKVRAAGTAELARLGWNPEVVRFAEDFSGGPKTLGPVLEALGSPPAAEVLFVGDTAHDRACASEAGVAFALAGWNPRAIEADGDLVLRDPRELLRLIRPD